MSQLSIHYRTSPMVSEGDPRLRRGPKAGERLPDGRVQRAGAATYLQQELCGPHVYLLLCGPVSAWDERRLTELVRGFPGLIAIKHLTRDDAQTALVDVQGETLARLGVENAGQYLVRPDGHVAFRCAGTELSSTTAYLCRWFISPAGS